jgi:hypothetical protein
MMGNWFSPILVGVGQVTAILVFFLYEEPDAFKRKPGRIGLTLIFLIVHILLQERLHRYVEGYGWGSMPALQFLAGTWCYYVIYVRLWSRMKWPLCCFVALIFLLVDNSVWPLLSSVSRLLCGINYLYEGSLWIRTLYILIFTGLECMLIYGTHCLLPEIGKIHLDGYNIILTLASVIPFLYIRFIFSQMESQDNKMLQIAMTVCCLVAIITLIGGVGRSSNQYEKIQETQMQYVLKSQQQQFEQKLRDIDVINRKYHDMKNILLYLESDGNKKEMQASIQQMIEEIRPYESKVETGHEVIDVILGEKLQLCQEKEITCVPYIDGRMFDFVKPLDLCTIFGNAMDNAIESCVQIPETEKRQINIHSLSRGDSVVLTFRNTYHKKPDLSNGLPVTTKSDEKNHGYGLRNMRYIADKYHGTVNCTVEQDEFVLTILLQKNEHPVTL